MPNGPTSLLVEKKQNTNDLLLIQRAFQKAGLRFRLKIVRNGDLASKIPRRARPLQQPAAFPLPFLVLLDLRMSGTDGRCFNGPGPNPGSSACSL